MSTPMLNRDFREFVGLLDAHRVDYMLVGGYALAAHGHPRYTGDIDFWVSPAPANLDRLLAALADFGFGSLGLKASDFAPDSVVQLGRPPQRIDLLTRIDGVEFDACFARRQLVDIGEVRLSLISLEDLESNKRASGRMKGLADLESLADPDDT